jgi:hypothetical protein
LDIPSGTNSQADTICSLVIDIIDDMIMVANRATKRFPAAGLKPNTPLELIARRYVKDLLDRICSPETSFCHVRFFTGVEALLEAAGPSSVGPVPYPAKHWRDSMSCGDQPLLYWHRARRRRQSKRRRPAEEPFA